MKRSIVRAVSFIAAFVAAGGLVSFPSACSSEGGGSGTTGKRIQLGVHVVGAPEAKAPFTNAQGWTITLAKAFVATGPLYYYDGATIFSELDPRRFWRVFAERTAFAHPGHYIPGNAKGQLLTGSSVDLRADNVVGDGDGISGLVRSATFSFQTPVRGPFAAELGSHVAVLEGTATKGGETRLFRAEIDAADIANTKSEPAVEGCPFTETVMEADGEVTVTIGVKQWFDQVELDGLPASTDGKPVVLPASFIGRNELVRGMKEGLGYQFSYAPKGT